jgi:hypothetical protein
MALTVPELVRHKGAYSTCKVTVLNLQVVDL